MRHLAAVGFFLACIFGSSIAGLDAVDQHRVIGAVKAGQAQQAGQLAAQPVVFAGQGVGAVGLQPGIVDGLAIDLAAAPPGQPEQGQQNRQRGPI